MRATTRPLFILLNKDNEFTIIMICKIEHIITSTLRFFLSCALTTPLMVECQRDTIIEMLEKEKIFKIQKLKV
jgi:hypothetical protein